MSENIVTLLGQEQIAERIREMGAEITKDYAGEKLVLVCVLKGSFVFTADLARQIEGHVRVEFLGVQSYGEGTESTGVVQITIQGRLREYDALMENKKALATGSRIKVTGLVSNGVLVVRELA